MNSWRKEKRERPLKRFARPDLQSENRVCRGEKRFLSLPPEILPSLKSPPLSKSPLPPRHLAVTSPRRNPLSFMCLCENHSTHNETLWPDRATYVAAEIICNSNSRACKTNNFLPPADFLRRSKFRQSHTKFPRHFKRRPPRSRKDNTQLSRRQETSFESPLSFFLPQSRALTCEFRQRSRSRQRHLRDVCLSLKNRVDTVTDTFTQPLSNDNFSNDNFSNNGIIGPNSSSIAYPVNSVAKASEAGRACCC